jgi:hypothetical protein
MAENLTAVLDTAPFTKAFLGLCPGDNPFVRFLAEELPHKELLLAHMQKKYGRDVCTLSSQFANQLGIFSPDRQSSAQTLSEGLTLVGYECGVNVEAVLPAVQTELIKNYATILRKATADPDNYIGRTLFCMLNYGATLAVMAELPDVVTSQEQEVAEVSDFDNYLGIVVAHAGHLGLPRHLQLETIKKAGRWLFEQYGYPLGLLMKTTYPSFVLLQNENLDLVLKLSLIQVGALLTPKHNFAILGRGMLEAFEKSGIPFADHDINQYTQIDLTAGLLRFAANLAKP